MSDIVGAPRDLLKVFVSYSRSDIDFADQLILALSDKGFTPLVDRHDIDAAEKWKDRLHALIASCDTVVFVLSDKSAASPVCRWEVEEAAQLGKRIIPVVPLDLDGAATPPPQLTELNYIHFFKHVNVPGSGFYDGVQKLERALRVDLLWLRRQTAYTEQATAWAHDRSDDRVLGGKPLEEALEWRVSAPAGATVSPLVIEYLVAGEAVAARRKAEAIANIAVREAALTRARRATLMGSLLASCLILLGGGLSWFALAATKDANENRAAIFAAEAHNRSETGRHAEAIQIALAGDPAARRGWLARLLSPQGYSVARAELAAAYTRNHLERVLAGHRDNVTNAVFSSDGRFLLTSAAETKLWDLEQGLELRSFPGRRALFSGDGALVLTLGDENKLSIFDTQSGQLQRELEASPSAIFSAAITHDGLWVRAACEDGRVREWDARTGQLTRVMPIEGGVAVSPNANLAMSQTTRGWEVSDLTSGRVLGTLSQAQSRLLRRAQFAEEGRVVWLNVSDRVLGLELRTGRELELNLPDGVQSFAISADSSVVVARLPRGRVAVFDRTGRQLADLVGTDWPRWAIAVSPDGRRVVTGDQSGEVRVWRVPSRSAVSVLAEQVAPGMALSPDGSHLFVGLREGVLAVVDVETGQTLRTFGSHTELISSVALSPDAKRVLVGAFDNTAALWDVESGRLVRSFAGHEDAVWAAVFSPDGGRVATASSDDTVKVWDARSGRLIRTLRGSANFLDVAFSPDGLRVAAASGDDSALVWEVDTGSLVQRLNHDEPPADPVFGDFGVQTVAFSSDGRTLLTGADSGLAIVWNLETGARARVLRSGQGMVEDASFSRDGDYILLGSRGGGSLWDNDGRLLQRFQTEGNVKAVAFSRDLRHVFLNADEVEAYEVNPILYASADDQIRMACASLQTIGLARYSDEDLQRFPLLRAESRDACVGVQ